MKRIPIATRATPALSALTLAMILAGLSGCASEQEAQKVQSMTNNGMQETPPPKSLPAVETVNGSWLMGPAIQVAAPLSPLLENNILYRPTQRVSLADVAAYITLNKGLVIDVSEVTQPMSGAGGAAGATPGAPGAMGAAPSPMMLPSPGQMGVGMGRQALPQSLQSMSISYEGSVAGLLDIVANKAAVWWRFTDGKVVFYRTETKTFYLPSISRKSLGNSTITTTTSGTGASTTGGTNTAASSGATITSDYKVDVWGDLAATAKAVGSGAQVVANESAGSLTVTGTPSQVRAVSAWIKELIAQMGQQVAITVHVYHVKITKEDTYNWDPSVIFKNAAGTLGYNLTPISNLTPASGITPLGLTASVLGAGQGAPLGANWGQYTGSQAALQALSTLGNVSETLQQTLVTLNGEPAPIQIANQQGYLASSSSMLGGIGTAAITTYTPGTVTTGFTATFVPRVVNGRVILSMTMTNSTLLGITTVGSLTNGIQTTNVDLNTFQQSVSLKPGDALLLSGVSQDNANTNNSGVGSASNAALGGGLNDLTSKSMIAIVVSAKVL